MTAHWEPKGVIKLTWEQMVWGITVLVFIAGMWTRMEINQSEIIRDLDSKADTSEVRQIDRDFRTHLMFCGPGPMMPMPHR
jgi:hypothetical protein